MGRVYVYIAGPYSHGDTMKNIHNAIDAAEALVAAGQVPFVPHLTHLWDWRHGHEIGYWYDYDLAWLARCDCLLRLPGESEGADNEVKFAKAHGIPVFENIRDCLRWAREQVEDEDER